MGLVRPQDVKTNITLAALRAVSRGGVIDEGLEIHTARGLAERLRVKAPSIASATSTLSGGNQQKVVLAKWLMTRPRVLLLDEPTRGIDVGAKFEIYSIMNELKREGIAIVMVSSELPEILGMSDRIAVMREGRLVAEFSHAEATQEKIMREALQGRAA